MAEEKINDLFARLSERRNELGLTERELSIRVTGKPDLVRDMKRRGHFPSGDNLDRLADELGVSVDWLLGRSDNPEPVASEVGLGDRHIDWNAPPPQEPGIPLVGTGDCADLEVSDESGNMVSIERTSFDPDFHARYIRRPAALRGARDIYAIYFHGESMLPRFRPGEIGLVDPQRPVRPGDDVVVQLRADESDEVTSVLVKELVRSSAKELTLLQHNPALTFTLDRKAVVRIHRIIPQTDLLL